MMKYDHVSCPNDLTATVLTEMLQQSRPGIRIQSIATKTISSAILSQVVEFEITSNQPKQPPLIAKFLKPSLPLSEMFRVEGTFYEHHQLPDTIFATPTCIATGPRFLLLEKVPDIDTYTLFESCPHAYIPELVRRMARLHAHYWKSSENPLVSKLSMTAGMGSALTGPQKQQLFAQHGTAFGGDLQYQDLCQSVNHLDLCALHNRVQSFQPTLIHGDFHVGNLLFRKQDEQIFLIDWATCGAGNPMVDFVFFVVVSTSGISVKTVLDKWLPFYHGELTRTMSDTTQLNVSLSDLRRHFVNCLINQFVILVCYDQTARGLLQQEAATPEILKMYNHHFDNVNQRCADAILESGALLEAALPTSLKASSTAAACTEEPQLLTEI